MNSANSTTLMCFPVVLVCMPVQSHSRRLDAPALPDPALSIRVSVPSSVRAQLQDPSSYLVLQNTESESDSSGTSSSCATSTTYDDAAGTLDVAACGYGSYSLRVMQTASMSRADGGIMSPSGMESTGVVFGYGAGPVAGVAVGAVAFVALGVVAAIAVRRRARKKTPAGSNKVVPARAEGAGSSHDSKQKEKAETLTDSAAGAHADQRHDASAGGSRKSDDAGNDRDLNDDSDRAGTRDAAAVRGDSRDEVQLHDQAAVSADALRKIQVQLVDSPCTAFPSCGSIT